MIYKKPFLILALCFHGLILCEQKLLFLEGNIGVGKSTFLQVVDNYLDVIITPEPCDEWQNVAGSGYNFLDRFYQDASRWGLSFQFYALITCMRKQEKYAFGQQKNQIMERSWFSDRYCFAQTCFDLGFLDQGEWALYTDMWSWLVSKAKKPDAFIYLRTTPEICYERIQKRARTEEAVIPLEYLQKLHDQHEKWLMQKIYWCKESADIPVLVLDASLDFKENADVQRDFMRQILDFLNKHENIDVKSNTIDIVV